MRGGRGGQLNSSDVTIQIQGDKEVKVVSAAEHACVRVCLIACHTFNKNQSQNN